MWCPGMISDRGNNAFTLMEILIVVFIIGILGMMVIPKVVDAEEWRGEATVRQIINDLQYAQNHAIVSQEPITVTFDVVNERYWLSSESGPVNDPITEKTYQVDLKAEGRFEGADLLQVDFAGAPSIAFDEIGAPDAVGGLTLKLGDQTYTIDVTNLTGQIVARQATPRK
jgi:prepilin-type N-terminal cleavage/methylation domain-containing protein